MEPRPTVVSGLS